MIFTSVFPSVPGFHVYWLGAAPAGQLLFRGLRRDALYDAAWMMGHRIIPGIVCLVLGAVQWYLIGR